MPHLRGWHTTGTKYMFAPSTITSTPVKSNGSHIDSARQGGSWCHTGDKLCWPTRSIPKFKNTHGPLPGVSYQWKEWEGDASK